MSALTPTAAAPADMDARARSLDVRSGDELVALGELMCVRLLTVALRGLQLACLLAVVAALARTRHADLLRTLLLAVALCALAALALRHPDRTYRVLRRRPHLALLPAAAGLACVLLDELRHSPLSFPAAVTIAVPAFVCGARWAFAAGTLLAGGVLVAAPFVAADGGVAELGAVAPGAVGYMVWAAVLSGLCERLVRLTLRLRQISVTPRLPPLRVANLAVSDDKDPDAASGAEGAVRAGALANLTARQLEVVLLLADGLKASEIAARLEITPASVYRHVHHAAERAGVTSRNALVAIAVAEGLVPSER